MNRAINSFNTVQWVSWLGATLIAAITLTSFVYANFQTKVDAQDAKGDLVQRLDRIENKVDTLIRR